MANSQTLGTYFRPRMRRADIEVPNGAVDVNSWAPSACYPRGSFYPLSDTPSTRRYQITKPDFRLCSTCRSRSQAPLCHYTLRTVTKRAEGTFESLRYSFGGDHPSQTTHHAMSFNSEVRLQVSKGWYFNVGSTNTSVPASKPPTYPTHYLLKVNTKL